MKKIKDHDIELIGIKIKARLEEARTSNHHFIAFYERMQKIQNEAESLITHWKENPVDHEGILNDSLNTLIEEMLDIPDLNHADLAQYLIHYYTITEKA